VISVQVTYECDKCAAQDWMEAVDDFMADVWSCLPTGWGWGWGDEELLCPECYAAHQAEEEQHDPAAARDR
jgi:hypothetical protein